MIYRRSLPPPVWRLIPGRTADAGLGFASYWRPLLLLNGVNQSVHSEEMLTLQGWRFRGMSGASGGNTMDSPTDYPLVQFRRLDNDRVYWLLPNPPFSFSDTSFVSAPLGGFPTGHYLVTVLVNGIPSNFSRLTLFHRTASYLAAQLKVKVAVLMGNYAISLGAKLESAEQSL